MKNRACRKIAGIACVRDALAPGSRSGRHGIRLRRRLALAAEDKRNRAAGPPVSPEIAPPAWLRKPAASSAIRHAASFRQAIFAGRAQRRRNRAEPGLGANAAASSFIVSCKNFPKFPAGSRNDEVRALPRKNRERSSERKRAKLEAESSGFSIIRISRFYSAERAAVKVKLLGGGRGRPEKRFRGRRPVDRRRDHLIAIPTIKPTFDSSAARRCAKPISLSSLSPRLALANGSAKRAMQAFSGLDCRACNPGSAGSLLDEVWRRNVVVSPP